MSIVTAPSPVATRAVRSVGLANATGFLNSLADRAGICLSRLDRNLRVLGANEHFNRQFGTCRGDLLGRDFYEFLHPKMRAHLRFQFGQLVSGRSEWFAERIVAVRPDVSIFEGEMTCVADTDPVTGAPGVTVLLKTESAPEVGDREVAWTDRLSELAARVLESVAAGDSNAEIARKLQLSRQGVEYHIGSMLRRFDVPNRAALVSRAFSGGLLAGGSWPPKVLIDFVR